MSHDKRKWYELEFPCKPGRVDRRPCMCAPYHYRLDWNIWFLGFKPHQRETWMWSFLAKILEGDQAVLRLLAPEMATSEAFQVSGRWAVPKWIKAPIDVEDFQPFQSIFDPFQAFLGAYLVDS